VTSEDAQPGEVIVGAADLRARVQELGALIAKDYTGLDPLLIGVLKGAFVFMADLIRAIPMPVEMDFMACASYGSSTRSSGVVRIVKDLDLDLAGRHVLIVEDIIDSGLTLSYLRKTLAARNPATLEVCALLVRESALRVDIATLRYVGFTIPRDFVVGYGLDADERWRGLADIRAWRPPRAEPGVAWPEAPGR
jgi:hypoxanthine phosphoribosyltransferase